MKSAELVGIRQFRVVESEPQEPASGEVQVRVAAVSAVAFPAPVANRQDAIV